MSYEHKEFDELTLADDFMFQIVMSDMIAAKEFIENLFNKTIEHIEHHETQSVKDNDYNSHGVRFDVEFVGDGTVYDIEMQRTGGASEKERQALLRRTRYYQASLDTHYLKKGVHYSKLPESRIIFICTFDPFGAGCAKYEQTSYVKELEQDVDTGSSVVYLNTEYEYENVPETIAELLTYIRNPAHSKVTSDYYIRYLNDLVENAKMNSERRREFMSLQEKLDEAREEGFSKGKEIGALNEREKNIQAFMKASGYTREEILKMLNGESASKSDIRRMKL